MHKLVKELLDELVFLFLNYFVCNIPIWCVRKFLYKLMGMKIGKGTRILMKTKVVCPWKIIIGDYTYINEGCFLDGRGGLIIGSNTTIAIYSKLITAYHDIDDNYFSYKKSKIKINNEVAVFADTIILPGVELGEGCVISAGSVVRRGIYDDYAVYAGNPIKYIRKRNRDLGGERIGMETKDFWAPILR